MRSRMKTISVVLGVVMVAALAVTGVQAQTEEEIKAAMKSDKTGTNPANFTYDARIYNEYRWLNTPDNGGQNLTTLEFRMPFANDKWQFRAKVRGVGLDVGEVDEYGFGDTDLRLMTVPYMSMQTANPFVPHALAPGLEVILDTASEDVLGAGATTLAPLLFFGYFNIIGPGSVLFPGYQHFFSVDTDEGRSDVNYGLIDLFLVKTFNEGQVWGYIDPQIILDYENSSEYMLLEIQAGTMLDKYFGTTGHSAYLLPSFGIGNVRPYDVSLEVGYKIIW